MSRASRAKPAAAAAGGGSVAAAGGGAAGGSASVRSSRSLIVTPFEVTDSEDTTSRYQLLLRWRSPAFTITAILPPRDGGTTGWLKSWNGNLSESLAPTSLPAAARVGYIDRVWSAFAQLTSDPDRYTITIKEKPEDKALEAPRRRSEMRLASRGQTLLRLPLAPSHHSDTGSKSPSKPTAYHAHHGDFYKHFHDDSLSFIKQVADVCQASQTKLTTLAATIETNRSAMEDRLTALQDRALRKTYADEALLGWFHRVLESKDKELERLDQETESIQREIDSLLMTQAMGRSPSPAGDSLGLAMPGRLTGRHASEADIRALLAGPVDDEGHDRSGDSASDRDEDDEGGGDSSAVEEKKGSKRRAPAKPRSKPAAAAAAAAPATKPARKPRAPAKPRAKKPPAESSDDEAKPRARKARAEPVPKRARKRIRSPSPVEEVDESGFDLDDSAAGAVARVAAYEAEQLAKAEAELPLMQRRTRAAAAAAPRPATPHASPYAASPSLPPPSLPSSPDDSVRASKRKKRRASPPPRVLPKRSLAEILRAGAAGLDGSQEDDADGSAPLSPQPLLPLSEDC